MLAPWKKAITNLDSIFKSRDITLLTQVRLVKAMVFLVVMYGYESWTIKKAEHYARDMGLIPGSGRSPGGGNGNPLQYSCLENPTDRGAWQVTVHAVAKSQTQLSK